jgi:ADP-ribose pyrophosphatase YjhB (NUDIX family)
VVHAGRRIKRRETLEAAARREVREEAGAEAHGLRLLGIYDNFCERKSDHVAIFVSERFDLRAARRRDRGGGVLPARRSAGWCFAGNTGADRGLPGRALGRVGPVVDEEAPRQ